MPPPDYRKRGDRMQPSTGRCAVNPVAGAAFSGIILIVLVYSTLDLTGAASRLGLWGTVLPVPLIGGLVIGIYIILKRLIITAFNFAERAEPLHGCQLVGPVGGKKLDNGIIFVADAKR